MGKSFTVPLRTVIGSKSEIAFSNITTGILYREPPFVRVRYQNLSTALVWEGKALITAAAGVSGNSTAAVANSLSSAPASPKKEVMRDIKEDGVEVEIAEIPESDKQNTESAAITKSDVSFSPFIFFAAAAALGLTAAAGFLFIRRG